MKDAEIKLEFGKYYHIYNHACGKRNLFLNPGNYEYFLKLYDKYIYPIAETYAWVLMKNHFHLLIRIREEVEIDVDLLPNPVRVSDPDRVKNLKPPHLYFSAMFNAYTQALNKSIEARGNLFERPFKRKEITGENYFRKLIIYIHTNPVHHGFTNDFKDYPWSSYGTIISLKTTRLLREKVIGWFDDKANFIASHNINKNEVVNMNFDFW